MKGEYGRRIVILSEAKDHLATLDPCKEILRFAQDDTRVFLATMICGVTASRP